jgi:acyl-CoA dehydrogenase
MTPSAPSRTTHFLEVVESVAPRLEEYGDQIEDTGRADPGVRALLHESGLMRMTLPEEWGGAGLTAQEYLPVLRRVAGFHGTIRMFVHGMNGVWRPLATFGTDEQKDRWLGIPARGELFAFALTEPDSGTGRDVATTAELVGDSWVINGRKNLISWASEAEVQYVIARTGTTPDGAAEISCILVPRSADGMTFERIRDGMGCRGSVHDRIFYEDVRVPAENLLGERGDGLRVGASFLDVSRLGIATSLLGISERAFELACDFVRHRTTFGKVLAERQAIQMMVGESAAELFSLASAIQRTAQMYDEGHPIQSEAAMCKFLGIEIAGRVSDRALRMHGGIGYMGEHRVERLYRDTRAMWFEEGTAEIQKLVASRAYLGA